VILHLLSAFHLRVVWLKDDKNCKAVLAFHGVGIRGFDYLQTRKLRMTGGSCHFQTNFGLRYQFWYPQFEIYQERKPQCK